MVNPELNQNFTTGKPDNKEEKTGDEVSFVRARISESISGASREIAGLNQYIDEKIGQNAENMARVISGKTVKLIGLDNALLAAEIITAAVCGAGGNDLGATNVLGPLILQSIGDKIEVGLPPEAQSLIETARREGVSGITGPLTTEAKDVVIGQEAAFSDRIVKFMDLVRALVVADNLKQRISRHKSFNVRSID
jgi:hypothetical protein